MTLAVLATRYFGDALDAISDGSLQVGCIIDVTRRVVATLVVDILGSIDTHHITSGKMMLVERVQDGSPMWTSLMLVGIYEKLGHCTDGASSFYFGSMLVSLFFKHNVSLHPPNVVVDETRRIVPKMR